VLANFYPSTTGPASITIQSNSAGSKVLEMGVADGNNQFSTSALDGDGIIRNSTGGRVLVQSGTGAAALTIGSDGVYFGTGSGTDIVQASCPIVSTLATGTAPFQPTSTTLCTNLNAQFVNGATYAQGSWTPGITVLSGSSVARSITVQTGRYVTIGSQTTLSFYITMTYSSCTAILFRIDSLPIASSGHAFTEGDYLGSYQITGAGTFLSTSLYYLLPNSSTTIDLTTSPYWAGTASNTYTDVGAGTLKLKGTITYINTNLS